MSVEAGEGCIGFWNDKQAEPPQRLCEGDKKRRGRGRESALWVEGYGAGNYTAGLFRPGKTG